MLLPCPNCGFPVAPDTPKSGTTAPRCPRCGHVLADTAADAPGPARAARPRTARVEPRIHTPDNRPASHTSPAAPARRTPSFARRRERTAARSHQWPLTLASLALALALALQLALARRDSLASDARWRPAVETLCGVLGCAVPAWREPAAFTMIDRSVRPKAGVSGVLTARASFRNDARWPQPWPTLVLTLSGIDGEPLGARAFAPDEYAGGAQAPLAPGQAASVQLDVVEPGPGVVAFAFDFR